MSLSKESYNKLNKIGTELGMRPRDLLRPPADERTQKALQGAGLADQSIEFRQPFHTSWQNVGPFTTTPFQRPVDGPGAKPRNHLGIDMSASAGTPVYSIGQGTVKQVDGVGTNAMGGNAVYVNHLNGKFVSYYAHLNDVRCRVGDKVDSNTIIGTCGSSGNAKSPHLHFAIYVGGVAVDPATFIGTVKYLAHSPLNSEDKQGEISTNTDNTKLPSSQQISNHDSGETEKFLNKINDFLSSISVTAGEINMTNKKIAGGTKVEPLNNSHTSNSPLSKEFYNKLNKISTELGMNPRDLLLVMYSESGLQSSIVNQDKKYGGAVGLIQFMPDTLRGLGVPKDEIKDFGKKSAEDQLDYVKKYVRGQMAFTGRPFKSASEYYHANFFPKTLKRWKGQDPIQNANTIIVSKDSPDKLEQIAYKANKGLDTNNDGLITVSDMTHVLMNSANKNGFQQALAQLNSVAGHGEVTEIGMDPSLIKKNIGVKHHRSEPNSSNNNGLEAFINKMNDFFSSIFNSGGTMTQAEDKHRFLIVVSAEDFVTKTEYARILQSVLDEELKVSSSIHYGNDDLELTCSLPFNPKDGFEALNEVCAAVSDVFEFATKKIGGCKANTIIISETTSQYPEMDIKIAEINRRKFQFKIAKGANVSY